MFLTDPGPDAHRAAIAERMRRLYGLAFHACGASHRAVQRSIGRDVRSMMAASDVPTLASVIDLARALEMRPSIAVALLVARSVEPHEAATDDRHAPPTEVDGATSEDPMLLAADLADDDMALERRLRRIPLERTALRTALLARIFAIRGATTRALALLRTIDIARRDPRARADPRALRLLRSTVGEVAIARPEAIDAIRALDPSIVGGMHGRMSIDASDSPSDETRRIIDVRERFHLGAVRALLAPAPRADAAVLDEMDSRLDLVRRSEDHSATAWAASITVLAALALLSRGPRASATADRIRRISVLAGFALEDVVRCGDPAAERLACARRARVVLAERATRARCGEDPFGLLDSTDLAELRAAALRFPESEVCVHPFRHLETFSQHRHSALDESLSRLRMPTRSQCARGGAREYKDRRQNAGR